MQDPNAPQLPPWSDRAYWETVRYIETCRYEERYPVVAR